MRLTTIASAALIAVSTAAIAQVGTAPEEQKLPTNGAVTLEDAAPAQQPIGNAAPAPSPSSTTPAEDNGEAPVPVGQRPPK